MALVTKSYQILFIVMRSVVINMMYMELTGLIVANPASVLISVQYIFADVNPSFDAVASSHLLCTPVFAYFLSSFYYAPIHPLDP